MGLDEQPMTEPKGSLLPPVRRPPTALGATADLFRQCGALPSDEEL